MMNPIEIQMIYILNKYSVFIEIKDDKSILTNCTPCWMVYLSIVIVMDVIMPHAFPCIIPIDVIEMVVIAWSLAVSSNLRCVI